MERSVGATRDCDAALDPNPTRAEDAIVPGRPAWYFRRQPVLIGAVLTVLYLPVGLTSPTWTLDGSWQLGMSLVHLRGIPAGPGFVFTYGPLGFLEYPNIVWLPGALLGLAYVATTAFAFYSLVCRRLLEWLPPLAALVVTVAFAIVTTQVFSVSELATAALLLWVLPLIRASVLNDPLPLWVSPFLGGIAALQLLVKFGPGCMAIAVAFVVAAARPPRARNLVASVTSFVCSFLLLWLAAQQSLFDVAQWLRGSLSLSSGYSAAMGRVAGFGGGKYWAYWLIAAIVLCAGLAYLVRVERSRAVPTVVLVALAAWYFSKEGLTRLDQSHADIAFVCLAALIVAIPWSRRWLALAVVGVVVSLLAVAATAGTVGGTPSRIRDLVTRPRHQLGEVERIVRATVQPSFRSSELLRARYTIGLTTGFSSDLAAPIRSARVHADPWSIATVWAFGLHWTPVPVFQTYSAYSKSLDLKNADSLRNRDGPNVVIREQNPYRALGRVAAWESPNYMIELTCSYEMIAANKGWQVLRRAGSVCGSPRILGRSVARRGQAVVVPAAKARGDIVVAAFDFPRRPVEELESLLLKPFRVPTVVIDGAATGFVVGTASQMHLVHVPERIGTRRITNGGLDVRSLSFRNAPGDVTVRFYELPTG
jgi:hypothetical protein